MLHRLFVLTSLFCCTLIVLSFGLFARDELAGASQRQQSLLAAGSSSTGPAQSPPPSPVRAPDSGQPRQFIDGASSKLTGPFRHLVPAGSLWALRLVEAIGGLLIYGVGLGYLARFSSGRAVSHHLA